MGVYFLIYSLPLLLFAAVTHRLEPHLVADSPSYINYPLHSLTGAMLSSRTPGYPLFLGLCRPLWGLQLVPLIQLLLHTLAVSYFCVELRNWGLGKRTTWAAGFTLVFGCTALDNVSTISTDCLAMTVGMISISMVARWARIGATWQAALPAAFWASVAVFIRPAYLSFVPWLIVAGTMILSSPVILDDPFKIKDAVRRAFTLGLMASVPILAWTLLRGVTVDSYKFVPFGNANLAGITVQLVSRTELAAMDGGKNLLAQEINRTEQSMERNGSLSAMILESQWDDLVWHTIVPANKRVNPDPAIQEDCLADLNGKLIQHYPLRYARWIMLGMRRAVWGSAANILMNPVLIGFVAIAVAAGAHQCYWGRPLPWAIDSESHIKAIRLLTLLSISYFLIMSGFVVLTSPPLGRFIDATAIYLTATAVAIFFYRPKREKERSGLAYIAPPVAPKRSTVVRELPWDVRRPR